MSSISYRPLLEPLAYSPLGARLATLSLQTKVEKFVLAEIAFAAETKLPGLEFRLEEGRRDLTVRRSDPTGERPLVEWVEAKMCYSDCVARRKTGHTREDEYGQCVAADAEKQRRAKLKPCDRAATLTTALFVFHRSEPFDRHAYYAGFKNRRSVSSSQVREEAIRYCTEEVAEASGRAVAECAHARLDRVTELIAFFYR